MTGKKKVKKATDTSGEVREPLEEEGIEEEEEAEEGDEEEVGEEEEEEELELDESIFVPDPDVEEVSHFVERRKTSDVPKRLTKYELTAIIGYRAQQLAEGAPSYVVVKTGMDAIAIAIEEFTQGVMPLLIERPYPTNKMTQVKYEAYRLDELINLIPL
jgi:DNA-directed RNA polymerase subunit K/omega